MVEGNTTVRSVGLEFNNGPAQIKLLSEVKARYERSQTRRSEDRTVHATVGSLRLLVGAPRCACAMVAPPAAGGAERADRDKPVNLEADRVDLDDAKKEACSRATWCSPRAR